MTSEFIFFLIFVEKILQKHILCISSELLLYNEYNLRTSIILTQASVITCK